MDKRKLLIQIDSDPQASVFDRIVALDAGADEVLSYGGVTLEQVRDLVHGAIFTRGPNDLKNTAIFIGGSDASQGERILAEVSKTLLPKYGLSVSVLLDPNGANTTASAAVRVAQQQLELKASRALVLGGTGPVGQRAALLLARQGTKVRLASRKLDRAKEACAAVSRRVTSGQLEPVSPASADQLQAALEGCDLVIAAGAAGVPLLALAVRERALGLRLVIDLNAVPPAGIEGVEVTDSGVERQGVLGFGAVGIGSRKMKIHQAAVRRLFERNDQVLDVEEIFALAETL